jgi:hypothetical protein
MKSSGTLRLIHLKNVADSISQYYFNLKQLSYVTNLVVHRSQRKLELEAKIFDATTYSKMVDRETFVLSAPSGNPSLVTEDEGIINEFLVTLHYIASAHVYSKVYLERLSGNANRLIAILEKEYPEAR